MKVTILILFSLSAAPFATAADKKSDKKTSATPTKAEEIKVPVDAVEVGPYTYRYTDPKGKAWIYRKTPFGISRTEDKAMPADVAKKIQDSKDQLIERTSATEDGDSIRFVRSSPFGRTEWKRKKAELNEIEQAVWSRELAKRVVAASASKD
jgi:hypothetical protein